MGNLSMFLLENFLSLAITGVILLILATVSFFVWNSQYGHLSQGPILASGISIMVCFVSIIAAILGGKYTEARKIDMDSTIDLNLYLIAIEFIVVMAVIIIGWLLPRRIERRSWKKVLPDELID